MDAMAMPAELVIPCGLATGLSYSVILACPESF